MSINFTAIFQDSLNFVRNKAKFILTLSLIYTILFFANDFLLAKQLNINLATTFNSTVYAKDQFETLLSPSLLFILLIGLFLRIIFYAFTILRIQQITYQPDAKLTTLFSILLKKIPALIGVKLIVWLPLGIGTMGGLMAAMQGKASFNFTILSFLSIFFAIRLNLAMVNCLVTNDGIINSLRHIWKLGKKQNLNMFLFFLLNYIVLESVSGFLVMYLNKTLFTLSIAYYLTSIIYIFSLIFSYRFYTRFTQFNT